MAARFSAYGWHVSEVDGHDPEAIAAALEVARAELSAPSLVVCRTTIGQGAPTKAGKSSSHGAPLGPDEVRGAKEGMQWPLSPEFYVPDALREGLHARRGALTEVREDWERRFAAYEAEHPELAAELTAAPDSATESKRRGLLPLFPPG